MAVSPSAAIGRGDGALPASCGPGTGRLRAVSSCFGRVLGFDPHLIADAAGCGMFTVRARHARSLIAFSTGGRMLTFALPDLGRGPDRVLVEAMPASDRDLPDEPWSITSTGVANRNGVWLPFAAAERQASDRLSPLRDVPGHFHHRLRRVEPAAEVRTPLLERVQQLFTALGTATAGAIEAPVRALVGFGSGLTPSGDDVLAGLILVGRAFELGRRHPVGWMQPLLVETRRVLPRTTPVSAAYLEYAIAGRTTALQEEVFVAMSRDLETQNEQAIDRMLAFGATSGADFLVGVRVGLDMVKARLARPLAMLAR